jgi:hypothetical protein
LESVGVTDDDLIAALKALYEQNDGGIAIGHHCSISAGVQIYAHDTVMWALSGGRAAKRTGRVVIGDCSTSAASRS